MPMGSCLAARMGCVGVAYIALKREMRIKAQRARMFCVRCLIRLADRMAKMSYRCRIRKEGENHGDA